MITNQQILHLSNSLRERSENLLNHFNIEFREDGSRYYFPCPVHNGDNDDGCSLYKETGFWQCFTGGCHEDYKKTIIGFVRGVLTAQKNRDVSFKETIKYCCDFLGEKLKEVKEDEIIKHGALINEFVKKQEVIQGTIPREVIVKSLNIPSKYYIGRGYSPEVLKKFDVGECYQKGKLMYMRAVVPVYDIEDRFIGCTGRTIVNGNYSKWVNSKGFSKSSVLYGVNHAKESIIRTRQAFLVESAGNLWRMHEANFENTLCMFGASLSEKQLLILESLPIETLIIGTDMDEPGEKAYKRIMRDCGRRFNYKRLILEKNDIGETSTKDLIKAVEKTLYG